MGRRSPATTFVVFMPRHTAATLPIAYEHVASIAALRPVKVGRTLRSNPDRYPTGPVTTGPAWASDPDTVDLWLEFETAAGFDGTIHFDDFNPSTLSDEGPQIKVAVRMPTCAFDWMRDAFTPLLEPLHATQAAIDYFVDSPAQPRFPTEFEVAPRRLRVDPSIYEQLVVGYRSSLVWLGSALRQRVPAGTAEVVDLSSWFAPSEALLGATWPTVESARPFLSFVDQGRVITWEEARQRRDDALATPLPPALMRRLEAQRRRAGGLPDT